MDLSSVGRCSALVVVPVLSLSGQSVSFLPTAYLSTHTGGFGAVHRSDLSKDMAGALAHWQQLGLRFDAVYVGYVGHFSQLEMIEEALPHLLAPGGKLYVDPVMGDQGRRYAYCEEGLIAGFRRLCARADAIFPNRTEAALLLGQPLTGQEPEPPPADALLGLGAEQVVVTGVTDEHGRIGVLSLAQGQPAYSTFRKRYPGSYPGTGDLLASCVIAALGLGAGINQACELACDMLDVSLQHTQGFDALPRFGLAFEPALPRWADVLRSLAPTDFTLQGE